MYVPTYYYLYHYYYLLLWPCRKIYVGKYISQKVRKYKRLKGFIVIKLRNNNLSTIKTKNIWCLHIASAAVLLSKKGLALVKTTYVRTLYEFSGI